MSVLLISVQPQPLRADVENKARPEGRGVMLTVGNPAGEAAQDEVAEAHAIDARAGQVSESTHEAVTGAAFDQGNVAIPGSTTRIYQKLAVVRHGGAKLGNPKRRWFC